MAEALLAAAGCAAVGAASLWLVWCVHHVAFPAFDAWEARRRDGISVAAERRARRLFLSKLDRKQRRAWSVRRKIPVVAKSGTRYVISPYCPYNVRTADAVFCLQVVGIAPAYDKLLAQKLLLESDESYFLALANARTFSSVRRQMIEAARADCRARGLLPNTRASALVPVATSANS